jgi:hypothetical protein
MKRMTKQEREAARHRAQQEHDEFLQQLQKNIEENRAKEKHALNLLTPEERQWVLNAETGQQRQLRLVQAVLLWVRFGLLRDEERRCFCYEVLWRFMGLGHSKPNEKSPAHRDTPIRRRIEPQEIQEQIDHLREYWGTTAAEAQQQVADRYRMSTDALIQRLKRARRAARQKPRPTIMAT